MLIDKEKALARLIDLCEDPLLIKIRRALGPEAKLHLVGGSTRDILCGNESVDLDLATSLKPSDLIQKLCAAELRFVETAIERGIVLIPGHPKIEITSFREPSGTNNPAFSDSVTSDLKGRDFTINAIAFSIDDKILLDPLHGIMDLELNVLRCVGSPFDRFNEDPLRILRMLRFGPAQDRSIHTDTREAALALREELRKVSIERIHDEFEKIIMSKNPANALRCGFDLRIIDVILPELTPMRDFEQNRFHFEDVLAHTLTVVSRCPKDKIVRLAALFHDAGKPLTLSVDEDGDRHFYQHEKLSEKIARSVLERLRFSKEDIDGVTTLVAQHMRSIDCGPSGARRIMRDTREHYDAWRQLKIADCPPVEKEAVFRERLRRFDELIATEKERLQGNGIDQLVINGDDLLALGFKEGEELGQCLMTLRDMIVEDPILNSRERLLLEASKILSDSKK
ncbi:MAG: HD domain-containing protein [SAR324 cluster bacterium]|uniref:HD domain-containing protein n=1 Tax=SAR324 cluster bacterium TaxID=2024889 RepID=A0A7X9FQM1_9DELT|nr:HD domain-containing protein [SAR324 cluster bacterium]